jgi:hypothetical protein
MKIAYLFSLSLLSFCASASQLLMLVTEEEMVASNKSPPKFIAKAIPEKDAPSIQVINPKISSTVTSPTPVEIKFLTADQSVVKPETFRVLYGAFQIDITKRILNVAKVTSDGVSVQAARLPSGKHRLILNVEDSQGRLGTQVIEFEVK